jgi:short-subunit dehydrogenase
MATQKKVAVVLGIGPGIGRSSAIKFGREGYAVALLGRTQEKLSAVQKDIEQNGGVAKTFIADSAVEQSVRDAFKQVREQLGDPEVLVINQSGFKMGSALDVKPSELEHILKVTAVGSLVAAQEVLPAQIKNGKGTILFTGATAALRGGASFSGFAPAKFALRALSQSLAREFQPKGIHVAHVIVDGRVGGGADEIHPDAVADTFWFLHTQHPSTWTLELDVRPKNEKF